MKRSELITLAALVLVFSGTSFAQPQAANASPQNKSVSAEDKRAAAYAKLMEGQRKMWLMQRSRPTSARTELARQAKLSFQQAIELDPTLAEGYTALAEIAISIPPINVEESIRLADIAAKINADNYGAHKILGRLYSMKSGIINEKLTQPYADKAVAEWKHIVRLDPRNAEGWAFLSEFYSAQGKPLDQIEALKKWISSTTPLETLFFNRLFEGRIELTVENATLKYGAALIAAGRTSEAVDVLSQLIADSSDNASAIDLLKEALNDGGSNRSEAALSSLQQAVYANPTNTALLDVFTKTLIQNGKFDEAVTLLKETATRLAESDKRASAEANFQLGEVYIERGDRPSGIAAYENALNIIGGADLQPVSEADREFATQILDKLVRIHQQDKNDEKVKTVIEKGRSLLGNDGWAEKRLVTYYSESGNRQLAVAEITKLREKTPDDLALIRTEAAMLTDIGEVDKAVEVMMSVTGTGKERQGTTVLKTEDGVTRAVVAPPMYDDYSNYIFISQLYAQAKRPKEAEEAAKKALQLARGSERQQIANLTLATAQQRSGNYTGAEQTLRQILQASPGNPIALNNLGYFLLERNEKLNEALDMISRAVKVDPTNPSFLDSLGWAHYKLGNFAEAEKNIKAALRMSPDSATINEHLGDVYLKMGLKDRAKVQWKNALELAKDGTDKERLEKKIAE